jgi:hypothetical protein
MPSTKPAFDRLFGAAERQREAHRIALAPVDRRDYDSVAHVQAGLGETAFNGAWAAGRAMSLEDAVQYAREALDSSR